MPSLLRFFARMPSLLDGLAISFIFNAFRSFGNHFGDHIYLDDTNSLQYKDLRKPLIAPRDSNRTPVIISRTITGYVFLYKLYFIFMWLCKTKYVLGSLVLIILGNPEIQRILKNDRQNLIMRIKNLPRTIYRKEMFVKITTETLPAIVRGNFPTYAHNMVSMMPPHK